MCKGNLSFGRGGMYATLQQVLQDNRKQSELNEEQNLILIDLCQHQMRKTCTRKHKRDTRKKLSDFDDVYTILANRYNFYFSQFKYGSPVLPYLFSYQLQCAFGNQPFGIRAFTARISFSAYLKITSTKIM